MKRTAQMAMWLALLGGCSSANPHYEGHRPDSSACASYAMHSSYRTPDPNADPQAGTAVATPRPMVGTDSAGADPTGTRSDYSLSTAPGANGGTSLSPEMPMRASTGLPLSIDHPPPTSMALPGQDAPSLPRRPALAGGACSDGAPTMLPPPAPMSHGGAHIVSVSEADSAVHSDPVLNNSAPRVIDLRGQPSEERAAPATSTPMNIESRPAPSLPAPTMPASPMPEPKATEPSAMLPPLPPPPTPPPVQMDPAALPPPVVVPTMTRMDPAPAPSAAPVQMESVKSPVLPTEVAQSAAVQAEAVKNPPPPNWGTGETRALTLKETTHEEKKSEPAAGNTKPAPETTKLASLREDHPSMTRTVVPAAFEEHSHSADSSVRMVNSKRIVLNYEVKDVGSSGVTDVELWYTRDGRTWQKHSSASQSHPPYIAEVDDEDLYGFSLIVRSGAGLGKLPPKEGDRPQVWVEVDTTKPTVRLLGVETGREAEARNLSILWRATDKNLGARPITISYAAQPEGPWQPIAAKIENTGCYVWQMPAEMPHHFHVRIEAADLAGNIGVAQTPGPVLDDLSQPSASIVNVGSTN